MQFDEKENGWKPVSKRCAVIKKFASLRNVLRFNKTLDFHYILAMIFTGYILQHKKHSFKITPMKREAKISALILNVLSCWHCYRNPTLKLTMDLPRSHSNKHQWCLCIDLIKQEPLASTTGYWLSVQVSRLISVIAMWRSWSAILLNERFLQNKYYEMFHFTPTLFSLHFWKPKKNILASAMFLFLHPTTCWTLWGTSVEHNLKWN